MKETMQANLFFDMVNAMPDEQRQRLIEIYGLAINEEPDEQNFERLKEYAAAHGDIMDNIGLLDGYAKQGISASVSINPKKVTKQQPKDAWKKKKAKRLQQKQSRRKR